MFSVDNSTPLWSYQTSRDVETVSISGNGHYIIAGNNDNEVFYFSRDSSLPIYTFEVSSNVETVSMAENGKGFSTSTLNGQIYYSGGPFTVIESVTLEEVYHVEDLPLFVYGKYRSVHENITSFHWLVNNATLINSTNFMLSGLDSGDHLVSHWVIDVNNISSLIFNHYLTVTTTPEATILSSPDGVVKRGEVVIFSGQGNDDNEITKYEWSSSIDGIFSNDSIVSISTLSNGTHLVSFRVQDNHGYWSDYDTATFVVNGRPISNILNPQNNSIIASD